MKKLAALAVLCALAAPATASTFVQNFSVTSANDTLTLQQFDGQFVTSIRIAFQGGGTLSGNRVFSGDEIAVTGNGGILVRSPTLLDTLYRTTFNYLLDCEGPSGTLCTTSKTVNYDLTILPDTQSAQAFLGNGTYTLELLSEIRGFVLDDEVMSTFATGTITYQIDDPVRPGVPEPATWACMLAGFGLIGGGMRRSRARLAHA